MHFVWILINVYIILNGYIKLAWLRLKPCLSSIRPASPSDMVLMLPVKGNYLSNVACTFPLSDNLCFAPFSCHIHYCE